MQFISLYFLIFLPFVAMVNYLIPRKYKYIWLFITSLVFYLSVDIKGAAVMALSIMTTYIAGLLLEKQQNKASWIFIITMIFNLGILLAFKYLGYLASFFPGKENVTILAPLGISFYLLKAVSYLIDVKRKDIKAEKNIIKYALYVSFFPQVISGPIERSKNMLSQFSYPLTVDYDRLRFGFMEMLWGYFLKLVMADRMAIFVGEVYKGSYAGTIAILGTLFYSFEIYCDFAGYSHIAIGAARILGIDVMKNFDSPYFSRDIAEFWRRWHISLSSWLRDYVYIPLGGNRKGTARKYLNVLVVFLVSGIWHGAGLTFIIWGLLHGLYQVIGYLLRPFRDWLIRIFKIDRESFSHVLVKTVITFLLVNFAWIFFRADSCYRAIQVIKSCFVFDPWVLTSGDLLKLGLGSADMILLLLGLIVVVFVDYFNYKGLSVREKIMEMSLPIRWAVLLFGILLIFVCGIWGPGYDASTFIYQQF